MSISLKELLRDVRYDSLSKEQQSNIMTLLERVNKVREKYGKPLTVTSGFRSKQDHIRIYSEIASKKGVKFDESKVPMGSCHLKAAAVDFSDPKQELQKWCLANEAFLAEVGLWCEDFSATKNWVHFQVFPPKSGVRFFKP